jgi:hypothetical protein
MLSVDAVTVVGDHEIDLILSLANPEAKNTLSRQRIESVDHKIRNNLKNFTHEDQAACSGENTIFAF